MNPSIVHLGKYVKLNRRLVKGRLGDKGEGIFRNHQQGPEKGLNVQACRGVDKVALSRYLEMDSWRLPEDITRSIPISS